MKKLTLLILTALIAFAACASPPKKTPTDYEGQRERARQEFRELDKE